MKKRTLGYLVYWILFLAAVALGVLLRVDLLLPAALLFAALLYACTGGRNVMARYNQHRLYPMSPSEPEPVPRPRAVPLRQAALLLLPPGAYLLLRLLPLFVPG